MSTSSRQPEVTPLLEVLSRLAEPLDNRTLLPAITAAAQQLLRAERAAVWLKAASEDVLVLEVAGEATGHRLPFGRGLAGTTAATRAVLDVPDCRADPRFDPTLDLSTGFTTRNSLTLPLIGTDGSLVGVLQVLNRRTPRPSGEHRIAAALAAQCSIALLRTRAAHMLLEAQRSWRELELARQVQRATMPQSLPVLPGYTLAALYQPAEMTGGDAYDLRLGEDGLLLMLADASGHGLAPALASVQMHAMLRVALAAGVPLRRSLACIDRQLCELLPANRFVSAWIGRLDPRSHRLVHYSAGQAPVLMRQRGTVQRLPAHGPPLGVGISGLAFTTSTIELQPGDALVVASDGLFEQVDGSGRPWGVEVVEATMMACPGGDAQTLAQALMAGWLGHRGPVAQEDDLTVLVLCRTV